MSRSRSRHTYGEQSWWAKDHGGLPGWAIVAVSLAIAGLGVVIVVLVLNPR